jgi:hypothetical protein
MPFAWSDLLSTWVVCWLATALLANTGMPKKVVIAKAMVMLIRIIGISTAWMGLVGLDISIVERE